LRREDVAGFCDPMVPERREVGLAQEGADMIPAETDLKARFHERV